MTDLRACFLGDSFTLGTGDAEALGWPGRVHRAALARGERLTVHNLGIRGQTGAQIAARASRECAPRLVNGDRHAVVLSFGANDVRLDRPVEETAEAAKGALAVALEAGRAAFFVSTPPADEGEIEARRLTQAMALREACLERGVPFLDLRGAVDDWRAWRAEAQAGDGIHPGAGGYALIAAAFDAWPPWRRWLET